MKAILYNRILLFLGFAGIFIAGNLTLAKAMNVVLPCGGSSSCETVTNDPSSMLFGIIPIAYIGLGAYIVLTVLAFMRTSPKAQNYTKLVLYGYLIAASGAVISIGLQFYSIFFIHALCKWCLASAVTMTASLILYALYYQDVLDLEQTSLGEARVKSAGLDSMLNIGFAALALVALGYSGWSLRFADHSKGRVLENLPPNFPLIPAKPNVFGDIKAPIKVIEFADLNCPSCQKYSPMLKDFVRQHQGAICVIYRHFPLPMHKTSSLAAAIDEYAAEKGKFWDYTMAVMGEKKEIDDSNELFAIATQQGLDVNDLRRRLSNDKDPIYIRLNSDENAANVVGVSQTPTFIVEIPGNKPKAFTGGGMLDAFGQKPYTDYLGAKS